LHGAKHVLRLDSAVLHGARHAEPAIHGEGLLELKTGDALIDRSNRLGAQGLLFRERQG